MSRCYNCRAENSMQSGTIRFDENVGKFNFATNLPARTCAACGESLFHGADLGKFENLIREALHGLGAVGAETMIKMRKYGGMTRLEVSQRLNVSLDDVLRWETIGQAEFGAKHVEALSRLVSTRKLLSPRAVNSECDGLNVWIDFEEPERSIVVDEGEKV